MRPERLSDMAALIVEAAEHDDPSYPPLLDMMVELDVENVRGFRRNLRCAQGYPVIVLLAMWFTWVSGVPSLLLAGEMTLWIYLTYQTGGLGERSATQLRAAQERLAHNRALLQERLS